MLKILKVIHFVHLPTLQIYAFIFRDIILRVTFNKYAVNVSAIHAVMHAICYQIQIALLIHYQEASFFQLYFFKFHFSV